MKTLIFNGSPRKNGDTAALINLLTDGLSGEFMVVEAYRANICACVDCRACRTQSRCAIIDEMQEIYDYIADCDNVVIASPIYYNELTGRLLDTASRFQMYFSARFFRHEEPAIKPKKGGVILVGGGDGDPGRAFSTARILLHQINVTDIFPLVCSHSTNTIAAAEDEQAVAAVKKLARFLETRT